MKLQAMLGPQQDQFILFLNDEDVYHLQRFEDNEEEDGKDDVTHVSQKITATMFKVNEQEILATDAEKSIRAVIATLDRKLTEAGELLAQSIELKDLACS